MKTCRKRSRTPLEPGKDYGTKPASIQKMKSIVLSFGTLLYLAALPADANSTWLECSKSGYLINLDERTKSYTLNDWSCKQNGVQSVCGNWFHGPAIFSPGQVEFVFIETMGNRGDNYILRNRITISRIDLRYHRYFSRKVNRNPWTEESAPPSSTGICKIVEYTGTINKF